MLLKGLIFCFYGLCPVNNIQKCLEKQGYTSFTDLQKKAFKEIVKEDSSIIIIAPTGSGKTEAALLPVMYKIVAKKYKPIAAIYITPLRALNRDIERRLKSLAKCFNLRVELRHGDTPYRRRKKIEENPPHILVTTPETFNYILLNEKLASYLKNIRFIIIDEFRELLESKRGMLLFTNLYLLEKLFGYKFIKIALTATLRNVLEASLILSGTTTLHNVKVIKDEYSRKMEINVKTPKCSSYICKKISEIINDVDLAARLEYILQSLKKHDGVIIFVNTRSIGERLGFLIEKISELLGSEIPVSVHHSSLSRQHRLRVEEQFKQGQIKGLIATSSMELGIDIGHIDYVIQYMSPRQVSRLIQRIGRSGHKLSGVSRGTVLVQKNLFQVIESLVLTRRAMSYQLEKENIPCKPLDVLAYSIVLYATIKPGINKYELYSLLSNFNVYSELEIDEYEELLDYLVYARLIKVRENRLYPTRRSKLYLYRTSMIPATRDVDVINVVDNVKVGVLNEEYVLLNISEDDVIVLGGKPWKVISYDDSEGKLYVELYDKGQEIIIPHWEGENIPVDYYVAREVGSIIRRIKKNNELREYLPILTEDVKEIISKLREEQACSDNEACIYVLPQHGSIIVNLYVGTKVNKLLRDLFKSIILWNYPYAKVKVYSSPYSVIITTQYNNILLEIAELLRNTLLNLEKYLSYKVIKKISIEQGTLLWRIFQVAQRFGAIDVESTRINRRILEAFSDTIIGKEAFAEVLYKDYDLIHVKKLAEMIKKGSIKIKTIVVDKYSFIVSELLRYIGGEIVVKDVELMDKEKYVSKIMNRKITLVCIKCGYSIVGKLQDLLRYDKCPSCGAKTLAPIKSLDEEEKRTIQKFIEKKRLNSRERRILEDLRRRAILYAQFGELALIALASRGVGVSEAIRIINKVMNGADLFKEILESEKKYLRIKKFLK